MSIEFKKGNPYRESTDAIAYFVKMCQPEVRMLDNQKVRKNSKFFYDIEMPIPKGSNHIDQIFELTAAMDGFRECVIKRNLKSVVIDAKEALGGGLRWPDFKAIIEFELDSLFAEKACHVIVMEPRQ